MNFGEVYLIAPRFDKRLNFSTAEVLGSMVYLWGQINYYRHGSIESALSTLIPIINSRNFVIFFKGGIPFGYVNWVYMNDREAAGYIANQHEYADYVERFSEDGEGKNIWMVTSFFPTGAVHSSRRILRNKLFIGKRVHFLYHKSKKVKVFAGVEFNK